MADLSVCIVTYNEAVNIEQTLKTINFAKEIIIVDSYSTDGTVEICKKYTDHIFLNNWEGCGIQKNIALAKATCEWVLILDADERLSEELQQQIKDLLLADPQQYAGYYIPFKTFYLYKWLRYGNCFKEKHLRLFRKNQGKIIPNHVHFGLEVTGGKIGSLSGHINHYSFMNLEKVLTKMNLYSTLGAKDKLLQKTPNCGVLTAIYHGLFAFIKGYIVKLGFLDGKLGFVFAIANAEYAYYKYIKLMLLQSIENNS